MRTTRLTIGGALVALALMGLSAASSAQDIDFGDDASQWASDGECDDARFEGEGMASRLEPGDIGHDATDCRIAFEAGDITLIPVEDAAEATANTEKAPAGDEVAPATEVTEAAPAEDSGDATAAITAAEIDFGNDGSVWANDGECDDPRFTGAGMAESPAEKDTLADATDCRAAFEAGAITLIGDAGATAMSDPVSNDAGTDVATIDFGDDSSQWANDQECDDPRFTGSAMATSLSDTNIGRDATDCENAFNDGEISFIGEDGNPIANTSTPTAWLAVMADRIDFGDDSGTWPRDGECDDPDFVGPGAYAQAPDSERMRDASDCRAAFIDGTVTFRSVQPVAAFDYGSDFSQWANDGECDDWRFTGAGMAKKLTYDDVMGDATDCRTLEAAGEIAIKLVYQPDYALNAPYDSSGVDFGDNSSPYANDSICDDPRFEGPGVASTLLESDRLADSDDCRAAYEQGTIMLRDGES